MRQHFHGWSWLPAIVIVGTVGFVFVGCSGRTAMPTAPLSSGTLERGTVSPLERSETKPPDKADYCETYVPFASARFSHPRRIDNPWSPLVPGTQYVLTGQSNPGPGILPHEVVFTVTDVVKEINGIECVALWDRDFENGALAEAELAFFAQDDDGNLWMMGEYPEEYDPTSGEFQGAPSTWIAGLDGAEPGTLMLANPVNGTGWYLQARVESIRFLDCGRVFKTKQKDCVPIGCFDNVLIIDERGPIEQNSGHQRKSYARGVGNIRVDFVGDTQGEVLVQTRRKQLSAAEMAEARAEVLRLDGRGFQFNDVYAQTVRAR
jgi:hypothetical protein